MKTPSKNKSRKYKPRPTQKQQGVLKPNLKLTFPNIGKYFWNIFAGFGLIVSIYATIPYAYRIAFPTVDLTNKSQPLDGPFTVMNDGWLTINDVKISFDIDRFKAGGLVFTKGIYIRDFVYLEQLEPGCSFTFSFSDKHITITPMPHNVKMAFDITFRPTLLPLKISKRFPFHTREDKHGNLRWYPGIPLKEK